jgi:UDP-N-acetylglucosamine--N-acetylmuramyl-(pentapeptide) pyrophosphoryl-undecaprenol N-acetylglucosamine transferase
MTGGGVFPALAVLQALENKAEDILWVGSRSGMEETLLAQYRLPFKAISAAGIHGIGILHLPKNSLQLFKGWQESKVIIHDFKPHVIFFTGGYLGIPMSAAARNIPSVVFIPDIEPGLALKIIMRSANSVAVSTDLSLPYIRDKKKARVTGYPLRKEIKRWNRKASRAHFNIPMHSKVLLVFGGSKGARSINQALMPILNKLIKDMHVIHITGMDNWKDVQTIKEFNSELWSPYYHAFPFLHEDMGAAFAAADLAVCRAGASTIGELPYFGLPAIMVPYPHAWRYQHQNAEYLINKGGAEIIEDKNLSIELYRRIIEIISDKKKLESMGKNMQALAVVNAEQSIANLLLETGQNTQRKRGR